MGVDHGRPKVFVTQKLLHGSDVVSILQQMCGEGVPKGMTTGPSDDARLLDGFLDSLL